MRRIFILALWLLADLLAFIAAYALAYVLRVGPILSTDFPLEPYLRIVVLVAPLWLLVLVSTRSFQLFTDQRSPRAIAFLAYAALVGTALFALAYYFSYGLFFSRTLLGIALALTFVMSLTVHWLFDVSQRSFLRRDPPTFPTLIIGVTRESTALIQHLNGVRSPLRPVAILDGRGTKEKEIDGVPVLGRLNLLEETITRMGITHLIQCSDLEQSLNLLSACRSRGISYLLLPSVLGIIGDAERVEMLEGHPVTIVEPNSQAWWHEFF
jgi:FlaA1/EpsC-like NDP-sugar epimerase